MEKHLKTHDTNYIFKIVLVIIILLSIWHHGNAQNSNTFNDDALFSKTQIGLNFTGSFSHFIVSPQSGPNEPQSTISPGFEGTMDIGFNINPSFGVQIGVGGGYQNYNYIISRSYDQYGRVYYNGTGSEIGYLTAPIEFLVRKQISDHVFIYGGAGFTIRLYDTYDGAGYPSSGDSTSKNFVKMAEITSSGPLIMMIPRIDLGVLLQLPYNDLLKFGLSFDIGQFSAYTSTYKYLDYKGNSTGSGSYIADASFVGLNIGYVFTGVHNKSNVLHQNIE